MKKIYIDAGHGGSDPGAVYGDIREKNLNLAVAKYAAEYLRDYECSVTLNRTDDSDTRIADMAEQAKKIGAECYLSVHHNAGGGVGCEVYYWKTDEGAKLLAQELIDRFAATGQRSRGIKPSYNAQGYRNFGVCRINHSNGIPAVLGEFAFIDSEADRAKIDSDAQLRREGEAYALAAVSFLGLAKRAPSGKLYRVQVGAYSKRENADALVTRLAAAGFEGSAVYGDAYWRVRCGGYDSRAAAVNLRERLEKAGFSGFVVYA